MLPDIGSHLLDELKALISSILCYQGAAFDPDLRWSYLIESEDKFAVPDDVTTILHMAC